MMKYFPKLKYADRTGWLLGSMGRINETEMGIGDIKSVALIRERQRGGGGGGRSTFTEKTR